MKLCLYLDKLRMNYYKFNFATFGSVLKKHVIYVYLIVFGKFLLPFYLREHFMSYIERGYQFEKEKKEKKVIC